MKLKILLPHKVFADAEKVTRIVMQTGQGAYGIWPQRLDCVAALVPGIFQYETQDRQVYLALEEGVLVKTGSQVMVSVRKAVGGADLGQLQQLVETDFREAAERERSIRAALLKLESTFLYNLEKFRKRPV